MNLYGTTISMLERGLDYSSTKGKVIAQNIANVDTPNYKAKSVSFKKMLTDMQQTSLDAYRTDNRHFRFPKRFEQPGVFQQSNVKYRQNGNSVDMDKEQADLAKNQIYYHALVDRLSGKFNSLQNVIKGGR